MCMVQGPACVRALIKELFDITAKGITNILEKAENLYFLISLPIIFNVEI